MCIRSDFIINFDQQSTSNSRSINALGVNYL